MKLLIVFAALFSSQLLVGQSGYLITYESSFINDHMIEMSQQLPPGHDRDRMVSFNYMIRTFRLVHVNGISRYEFVSTRYEPIYTGEQFDNTGTSTVHYKDIRQTDNAEVIEKSNKRGCVLFNFPAAQRFQITDSTKVQGDLLLQKATLKEDPNVFVWFAPRIPILDGPMDLAGFPGLVVEYNLSTFKIVMVDIQRVDVDAISTIERPDCPVSSSDKK